MLITANGLTFTGNYVTLSADSGTTAGNGGIIKIITAVTPVAIGTESDGEITLTADSSGEGNGGTILVSSPAGITADSASISVVAMGSGTGGIISLDAGNSDLSLSGSLNASGGTGDDDDDESGGSGGSISLSGANIALPDGINSILFADGNGTGKGGDISLTTTTGDITVGTGAGNFLFEAKSNGSGDGGTVTVNSAGNATVDGDFIDVSAGSNGNGGEITVASGLSDIISASGTLDTSGDGSGSGGNITLNSAGILDLSNATLRSNGGVDSGDAGKIFLTYASAGDLNVRDLTAISSSDTGGLIEIANSTADLNLNITGILSTADSSDQFAGSLTLNVADTNSNAISVFISSTADFNSVISGIGSSVSISALSDAIIGIHDLEATTGDINICADGSGSCTVATISARKVTSEDAAPLTQSLIGFDYRAQALNGDIIISGQHIQTLPASSDTNIIIPGATHSTTIKTEEFDFGSNTYILGNASSTTATTIESYEGDSLVITVPADNAAGIKSASNIYIDADGELDIDTTIVGTPSTLFLEASNTAVISTTGQPIFIDPTIGSISGGTAAFSGTPNVLVISGGDVRTGDLVSLSNLSVASSASGTSTGILSVGYMYVGNASHTGTISLTSADAMTFQNITEYGGGVTAYSATSLDTFGQIIAYGGPVSLQALGTISVDGSIDATGGDISIFVDTTLSTGNTGAVPANVNPSTQVFQIAGGTVYWGDTASKILQLDVASDGTPRFIANFYGLNFDANRGLINIESGVTLNAHN
jgi:hypothetical protein